MPGLGLDTVREQLQHMEWADASVWRAVLACPPAEQDARLRDLLVHLHLVQRVYLAAWTLQDLDRQAAAALDLHGTHASARAYYQDLWSACADFDEAALRRPIRMPGMERYEQQVGRRFDTPTLADTVLQVTGHSTYHRGQVNARLRELGATPPTVDYIIWFWFGRPAAEWPTTRDG